MRFFPFNQGTFYFSFNADAISSINLNENRIPFSLISKAIFLKEVMRPFRFE